MSAKFTVSADLGRWISGTRRFEQDMHDEVRRQFAAANDVFYDKTQQYVHVETGNLKSSGKREYEEERGEVTALLVYDTDYAIYEENRGGSHAYMSRGWQAAESTFERAMPEAFERVVGKWRS